MSLPDIAATKKSAAGASAKTLPYTGREYLDSLDDGREIWIYGERVNKITEHPAFQNCARMIARCTTHYTRTIGAATACSSRSLVCSLLPRGCNTVGEDRRVALLFVVRCTTMP
jgi:hypothetical protein